MTEAARLPSERFRPGDPRQIGFQAEPSDEHVLRAAAAARSVAELVSMPGSAPSRPLRVCLCLVRLPTRLPFNLFGFHIMGVDEGGEFLDDLAEDGEVVYAVVVNQPVDLQRETAIAFLNELVGRQGPLADIIAERRSIADLPEMTASADAASAEASADALRFSLAHAADALKTRAAGLGYRLEVRFRMDPLPRRDDVIRRVPLLRRLYDTEDEVRAAVDSTVAMLGGQPMAIRGRPEEARILLQRQTALLGVRQLLNQALRDADVTGNGFVEFGFSGLDPTQRCLVPERVEVLADERFALVEEPPRELGRVLHLRGLEQFESPYGISPWEPLLYVLQRRSIIEYATEQVRAVMAAPDSSEDVRERAARLVRAAEGVVADTNERLDRLLWFPRRRLREVREDLYFSGQERFGE